MSGRKDVNLQKLRITKHEKIETLHLCPVFRDLALSEVSHFASRLVSRCYGRGDAIFHEGDRADHIYLVHAGLVRICKLSQSGKKLTFAILSQGDIVAISALHEQFYRMSFEALTDAAVLHISKDRFFEYVANHPQAATGLIALLVKRLTWECNKNVDRRSERVESRLVKCLSVLVSKFGTRLPITRKDLANYAGTTTETAIRVLGGLKAKGIVSGSRILGEIIVSDPVMLQTYGRTLGLTQTGAGEREFERSGSERKKRSWRRRPA